MSGPSNHARPDQALHQTVSVLSGKLTSDTPLSEQMQSRGIFPLNGSNLNPVERPELPGARIRRSTDQQRASTLQEFEAIYSKSPRFHLLFILRSPSQQFYTRFAVRKSRKPRLSHLRSLPQTRHIRSGARKLHTCS